MSHHHVGAGLDRRKLVLAATGTLAGAGFGKSLAWPDVARADDDHSRRNRVIAVPKPIPGGRQLSSGAFIHFFSPHPSSSLDIEPATMTDFRGSSSLAYLVGSAKDHEGNILDLEADIRAYVGEYIAEDGSRQRGYFAQI